MIRKTTLILAIIASTFLCLVGCGKEEEQVETEVIETPVVEVKEETWDSLEVSTLMNIYFRQLIQLEQSTYKQVLYEVTNGNMVIDIKNGLDAKSVDNVVKAIYYDNPELFWITGRYTFDGVTLTLETNKLADDLESNKDKFNTTVEEVVNSLKLNDTMDNCTKEKIIHDKLLGLITHDKNNELGYSAFEALVNGKATSGGYSKAFQLIMKQSGIPCYYSVGRLYKNGATSEHAWNVVRLGDNHYFVDATLNDTVLDKFGIISYEFYNVNSEDLKQSHTRNAMSLGLPVIEGTEFSYSEIYGKSCADGAMEQLGLNESYKVNNLEEFTAYMVNQINNLGLGEHSFKVVITSNELKNEVHYATQVDLQKYLDKLSEANKKRCNTLKIDTETYSLGDENFLLEVKINLGYVEPVTEEVNDNE